MHQPQLPAALRDEHVAVGQERERPGLDEGVGERRRTRACWVARNGRAARQTKHHEGRDRCRVPPGPEPREHDGPHGSAAVSSQWLHSALEAASARRLHLVYSVRVRRMADTGAFARSSCSATARAAACWSRRALLPAARSGRRSRCASVPCRALAAGGLQHVPGADDADPGDQRLSLGELSGPVDVRVLLMIRDPRLSVSRRATEALSVCPVSHAPLMPSGGRSALAADAGRLATARLKVLACAAAGLLADPECVKLHGPLRSTASCCASRTSRQRRDARRQLPRGGAARGGRRDVDAPSVRHGPRATPSVVQDPRGRRPADHIAWRDPLGHRACA